MGMVIRTDVSALNSARHLNKNQKQLNNNLEKLASGYRINHAADDASGLAITEKMRAQITSLETYVDNAENGISLIQTAEGSMVEISEMLLRGVELSMKAANGIYEDSEREMIQEEVDQLTDEIDRISDTANFNRLFYLRGPQVEEIQTPIVIVGNLPTWASMDAATASSQSLGGTYTTAGVDSSGNPITNTHCATYLDFSAFTPNDIPASVGSGFHTTCCTCNNNYSIEFTNEKNSYATRSGQHYIYKIGLDGARTADDVYDRIIKATNNGRPNGHYTQMKKENGKLVIYDNRPNQKPYPSRGMGVFGPGVAHDPDDIVRSSGGSTSINVGPDRVGKIYISLPRVSSSTLNVGGASVRSVEDSANAMERFKAAVNEVSTIRAHLGAMQNRIEHTIENLSTTHENISAAKSRIKDTDMAEEMMKYTQNNILEQSSQAMLAQANTKSQYVLQLLQ